MTMKTLQTLFATAMCRFRPFAFVVALCLLTSAWVNDAVAEVYRWVDDQGKTHYSEVVPQRYQNVAKPVDAPANADDEVRAAIVELLIPSARP
jgi:hypothetical protein